MVVSIHTPIQGVTSTKSQEPGGYYSFNPHTHTGCDYVSSAALNYAQVSIHTPIQGVTLQGAIIGGAFVVSIHTPIQGVTRVVLLLVSWYVFQSTHPYRV